MTLELAHDDNNDFIRNCACNVSVNFSARKMRPPLIFEKRKIESALFVCHNCTNLNSDSFRLSDLERKVLTSLRQQWTRKRHRMDSIITGFSSGAETRAKTSILP